MGLGKARRMKLAAAKREADAGREREATFARRLVESAACAARAERRATEAEVECDKLRRRLRAKSEELDAEHAQRAQVAQDARAVGAHVQTLQKVASEVREAWRAAVSEHADAAVAPFLDAVRAAGVGEGEAQRAVLKAALETFFGVSEAAFEVYAARAVVAAHEVAAGAASEVAP